MKNWILSHKNAAVTGVVLVVLVIAMAIFIKDKRNIEAMRSAEILNIVNQPAEMETWGEVMYSRIEIFHQQ